MASVIIAKGEPISTMEESFMQKSLKLAEQHWRNKAEKKESEKI